MLPFIQKKKICIIIQLLLELYVYNQAMVDLQNE